MTSLPLYNGWEEILQVVLGGAIGALVKDTLQDGVLQLPFVKDGKLFLGFIGGAVVGAFIGLSIDGSFVTAALGGYTGSSVLVHLVGSSTSFSRTVDKDKIIAEKKAHKDSTGNSASAAPRDKTS